MPSQPFIDRLLKMQKFIFAGLLFALTACATNGPRIEPTRLTELRKGDTTAAEIFREFGRPNFLSKNMDGSQMAVYIHSDNGSPLSSGSETVTFSFTPAGVLSDYKYSPPAASRGATAPVAAPAGSETAVTTKSATEATPAITDATAANPPAPATAASANVHKSTAPSLWDILRDSSPSDPRRR